MMIAGQVGEIHTLFDSTKDYCGRYLTNAPADFSYTVTREDIQAQQEALLDQVLDETLPNEQNALLQVAEQFPNKKG